MGKLGLKIDRGLATRLNDLSRQNEALNVARGAYLLKEAERKHFEACLVKVADGKSHAERLINAQAEIAWLKFQRELAGLETAYEFEKLKYDILDKAYLAEHLSLKIDGSTIGRQGGVT